MDEEWKVLTAIFSCPREEVEAESALGRELARKSAPIQIAEYDA